MKDRSKMTALYVEDDALIALDTNIMLQELGFGKVIEAHNLDEAVAHADNGVDFALLDINLGDGTNSIGLAERLAADGIPIVIATGYNPTENLSAHLDAPFVQKPYTADALERAISESLR